MSSNICNFFRNGHCKFKFQCRKSHAILTCRFGPYCTIPNCVFRHPKTCENFLLNKCGFKNKNNIFIPYTFCTRYHPPPDLLYTHPIVHPPPQPPYHPPPGLPHGTPHRFPHGAASTPAVENILTISDHSPENNKDSTWYGRKIQDCVPNA